MIKIVGDINLTDWFFDVGSGIGTRIQKGDDPFAGLRRKAEDFWIGNLECVVSDVTDKKGTDAQQFIISPSALKVVRPLDFYGVANNHAMQHGAKAYDEVLRYLENSNVQYAGPKEKKTSVIRNDNKSVAISVFSQHKDVFSDNPRYWYMPEYYELEEEISKYKEANYRIAYVHWGNEFIEYPYQDQIRFAHYLVDIGYNLIIGMHPHRLQGYEVYKGTHIFYSLGNCVFNMAWEPCRYSVIISLDTDDWKVSFEYLRLNDKGFPEIAKDVPFEYSFEHLNGLIGKIRENEEYYSTVQSRNSSYQKANRIFFIKNLGTMPFKVKKDMILDFVKRRIIKR